MEVKPHHIKSPICATRPPYREGKTPKSVKVSIFFLLEFFLTLNSKH